MMVTSISCWKGGADHDVFSTLKQAESVTRKHGAGKTELSIVHVGADAGAWMVSTTYRDWAAFGQAMQAYANDPELQGALAKMRSISTLVSHQVVSKIDF